MWGPEGMNKSEMCRVLAVRDEWLLEGFQLSWEQKQIIEQTEGIWVAEYAEFTGHSRREQGAIKDAASRRKEKARKAYGRYATEARRQFVIIANVNRADHLVDTSGNRRYLPLEINRPINIAGLRAVMSQLYGEAFHAMNAYIVEHGSPDIRMDQAHWEFFGGLQSQARVRDPIEDRVMQAIANVPQGTIRACDLYDVIGVEPIKMRSIVDNVRAAMKDAGWEHKRKRLSSNSNPLSCFVKGDEALTIGTQRYSDGTSSFVVPASNVVDFTQRGIVPAKIA
jgi:predicted P-loop ATPase